VVGSQETKPSFSIGSLAFLDLHRSSFRVRRLATDMGEACNKKGITQRLGMDSQSAVTSKAFALLPELPRER
jgi:hypothetical protein